MTTSGTTQNRLIGHVSYNLITVSREYQRACSGVREIYEWKTLWTVPWSCPGCGQVALVPFKPGGFGLGKKSLIPT